MDDHVTKNEMKRELNEFEKRIDKKLKNLENKIVNKIIGKLNIIAEAFDKPILQPGLPPYAGEN